MKIAIDNARVLSNLDAIIGVVESAQNQEWFYVQSEQEFIMFFEKEESRYCYLNKKGLGSESAFGYFVEDKGIYYTLEVVDDLYDFEGNNKTDITTELNQYHLDRLSAKG